MKSVYERLRKSATLKANSFIDEFNFSETLAYKKIKSMSSIDGFVNVLEFCNSLTGYVPTSEDPFTKKGFKLAGMAKILISHFKPQGSLQAKFIEERGLEFKNDPAFVNVFLNSSIKDFFKSEYVNLTKGDSDPHATGTDSTMQGYHDEEFGSIWFTSISESHGARGFGYMYHTPNFNFKAVLEKFWDVFEDGINVQIKHGQLKYTAMPKNDAPFSGYAEAQAKKLAAKHIRYKEHKVPRVTMFVGPPGIGKSTLVLKIAQNISKRVIRIEAESLSSIKPKDMIFLLGGLKPGCLIVDDVDRAPFNDGLSTMFTVLDWMKQEFSDVPMFMTANRVSHLDSAFMRPGRVDEVQWCSLPGIKNRLAILNTYIEYHKAPPIDITDKILIVKATKGLAIAWIKEIALQLKYESTESCLLKIKNMKRLSYSLTYSYGDESDEIYGDPSESDDEFDSNDEEWELFKDEWCKMDEAEKAEEQVVETKTALHACTKTETGMS